MEGTLDVWEGMLNGWKSLFVALFGDLLILTEDKGGAIIAKLKVKELKIDPKSEKESRFSITTGTVTYEFNAKDFREKIKWVNLL